MLRPCNRTHNMECVCTQGWYMSILDGTCKPCSECPSGYGVWRTCRWSRNTVCRQCQPGTFSGVSVGTLGCIPCSKCGPNQEMISGCDGNRDTVCIDRSALMDSYLNTIDDGQQPSENDDSIIFNSNNGNNPIVGSSSLSSSSSSSTSNLDRIRNHTNGVHLLPLYISMLVVIVFTFCIYALIQLKCNNSLMLRVDHQRVTDSSSLHMHNHQTKLLPPHPPPYNANNAMPLFSSALNRKESLQRKFHNNTNNNNNRSTPLTTNHYGQKTYNELLIGPTSPTSTTSTSIQSVPLISDDVEHLTIEIRQALENMLGKDTMIWRSLAKELGYDEKHIVQFEAKATTITNGLTVVDTFKAIRLLLLDWSSQMTTSPDDHHHQQQQQQSTETGNSGPPSLATLSNALIRIGRVDCARVIVRQNYQQQQR
uniref:Tumor necrosis factor receptor superfamily member 16-like n=1 Tax=Dermatophagoides pteronyssinus TaxID=6956 RepID=A0A6P6Y8S0_DERPT|nr:tumor necrosis factor receptor superfamily member 16-like [Dermatophagoides pteronyssinus]